MSHAKFSYRENHEDDASGQPRRKREPRKYKIHHPKDPVSRLSPSAEPLITIDRPEFDFLTFVALLIELQIGTVMPREIKPRDFLGVLGEGASFLVYQKTLPYDHLDQSNEKPWSAGTELVLKR